MLRPFALSTIAATLGIALVHFAQSDSPLSTQQGQEEWIHPNLVRVKLDGAWHEFPMVELMDPKCRSISPSAPECN